MDVGDGWAMPTQGLADQLILSQPKGGDSAPPSITCPLSFR